MNYEMSYRRYYSYLIFCAITGFVIGYATNSIMSFYGLI